MQTAEDLTEIKRAVHLMKKGYEVQKISVGFLHPFKIQGTSRKSENLNIIIIALH